MFLYASQFSYKVFKSEVSNSEFHLDNGLGKNLFIFSPDKLWI